MIRSLTLSLIGLLSLCAITVRGQTPGNIPQISLKRTTQKISLDGKLDEPAWYTGVPAKDFWQYFPQDSSYAAAQTEIFLCYDDEFLYIAAKCYAVGNEYITPSLRRDYQAGGSDNITFLFDPFNDRTNAFFFGLNPYGVQREGLIANGGSSFGDFSTSWDNKWYSAAKIEDGFWVAELAIPFKSIRFKDGSFNWRFNAYRFDTQSNEWSTWQQIPRNQPILSLAFMGDMQWEEPLKKLGTNISLIPFVAASIEEDFETPAADGTTKPVLNFEVGGDAKIAVTSGLNLDLTINPDFSQVEVDRQVTDLSRFEIFFPERRQFFLENADLFSTFGNSRMNPFFSRRIGVATDTITDNTIKNRILYGARLSGKLDNNWRLGLLNMQTAKDDRNDLPGYNYTVAALQRKVFSSSNIGVIFVNKQRLSTKDNDLYTPYNRVLGLDYNLASRDNVWTGKVFYHQAFTPAKIEQKFSQGLRLQYSTRTLRVEWEHQYVGEGFDAEVGFVPRKDYFRINPAVAVSFYPTTGSINRHGPSVRSTFFWNPEIGKTDHEMQFTYAVNFRDNSQVRLTLRNEYTYLFDAFDPTGTDGIALAEDTDYTYTSVSLSYNSDRRKRFSFRIDPRYGSYFNGKRLGIRGSFTYRYQPYGSISLNYGYNYFEMPEPQSTVALFLIGPRIDLTLSKNFFFTSFFQYNDQIDNINVNARLQWRFKPVSDFFLVYTDNYFAEDVRVKNRAIIAKLTYWLNL